MVLGCDAYVMVEARKAWRFGGNTHCEIWLENRERQPESLSVDFAEEVQKREIWGVHWHRKSHGGEVRALADLVRGSSWNAHIESH